MLPCTGPQPTCVCAALHLHPAGPVLVAVNPFKPLPLYGPDAARLYSQRSLGTQTAAAAGEEGWEPHVFLTADRAFKQVRGVAWPWVYTAGCCLAWHSHTGKHLVSWPVGPPGADGGFPAVAERAHHRRVGRGQDGNNQGECSVDSIV